MRTLARALYAASILVPVLGTSAALAQPHRWDGDIHHFQGHDFERWRGGAWFHGPHGGRDGWWWVVGPDFYFYPAPVYPYPDPYTPPVVAVAPPVAPAPRPRRRTGTTAPTRKAITPTCRNARCHGRQCRASEPK